MSIEQVKQLRDETGVSIMQCKKALEEAEGDMEKARIILQKKSSAAAAKKADREVAAGHIAIAHSEDGTKIASVELLCETDFVAKNEDFVALAEKLAQYALEHGVEVTQSSAQEMIDPVVQKVGENIKLGTVAIAEGAGVGFYAHNGQTAAVVSLSDNADLARDIAMHITAMKPLYQTEADIPEDAKVSARELFAQEVADSGKPAEMHDKILEGKMHSYFKEMTLMDQAFIKDPSKTIAKLLEEAGVDLVSFACYTI